MVIPWDAEKRHSPLRRLPHKKLIVALWKFRKPIYRIFWFTRRSPRFEANQELTHVLSSPILEQLFSASKLSFQSPSASRSQITRLPTGRTIPTSDRLRLYRSSTKKRVRSKR